MRVWPLALAAVVALGACDTPPLRIVYRMASGPTQSCAPLGFDEGASLQCDDVPMPCEAVMNIRILDPADPSAPFVSICELVPRNADKDVCPLVQIDLPDRRLPKQLLEVQVLVWPRTAIEDPVTGALDCRKYDVAFDATLGFPLDHTPAPALGGRGYYHPGDEEVVVTLGCTDLLAVNDPVCTGASTLAATATIDDFETGVSVSRTLGERLSVAVGEPELNAGAMVFELNPNDTRRLDLVGSGPTPAWAADIDLDLASAACVEVREDEPQATATLACSRLSEPGVLVDDKLTMRGVRLSKASLEQILAALMLADVPASGITIGIVLDEAENPLAGYTVTTDPGTVKYLSANRTGLVSGATSTSGIFVSEDAPYGSVFSTTRTTPPVQNVSRIGGLVKGKVTIVVLQFSSGGA